MNKEFLNKNICGNSVEILKKLEDKANISDEAYKLSRVLLDKYTKSK